MPVSVRRNRRGDLADLHLPRLRRRRGKAARLLPLFLALLLLGLGFWLLSCLRAMSITAALSEARDMVTLRVGETVGRILSRGDYGYDWFVSLEKDGDGAITAVTTNTARVNLLASELVSTLALEAENGHFDLHIPLGDLLGAGPLQGLGPEIPLRIGMMSSSLVRMESGLSSTGINQTLHSLTLVAEVDIDLLVPWGEVRETVTTRVPVAETVIVGRVPESYFQRN